MAYSSTAARCVFMNSATIVLQIGEVYSELSEEPVNAASLGQVYRGRLRATGEEVAVKVQRPSIADSIAMDMLLLRRLMAAADANIPQVPALVSAPHERVMSTHGGQTNRCCSEWRSCSASDMILMCV